MRANHDKELYSAIMSINRVHELLSNEEDNLADRSTRFNRLYREHLKAKITDAVDTLAVALEDLEAIMGGLRGAIVKR